MSRARFVFGLVAVVTAAAGCAHAPLQSPAAGGSAWTELTSQHLVLRTDYPESTAREALATFDKSARALIALAQPPGTPPPQDRLEVVVFERQSDYEALFDDHSDGRYQSSDIHECLVATGFGSYVSRSSETTRVLQHELTHWLLRHAVPNVPLWLGEGMARYWEALEFDGDNNQVIVGRPSHTVPLMYWPKVRTLLAVGRGEFYGRSSSSYYSAAWGLVHELYARHSGELMRYFGALGAGSAPDVAWQSAFAGITPEQLDSEIAETFRIERPWARQVPLTALPYRDPEAVRQLPPAEVHFLWARLRPKTRPEKVARSASDLAEAQRLGGDSAELQEQLALLELHEHKIDAAAERLARAAQQWPESAELLAAYLLALDKRELAKPEPQRDFRPLVPLARQLAALDGRGFTLGVAAYATQKGGDVAAAAELAARAVAKAPACQSCFEALSLVSEAAGDLAGAIAAAERAVQLMPEGTIGKAQSARLDQLRVAAAAKRISRR